MRLAITEERFPVRLASRPALAAPWTCQVPTKRRRFVPRSYAEIIAEQLDAAGAQAPLVGRGLRRDAWIDIRRRARACHEEALKASKGDRRAQGRWSPPRYCNDDLELRHYEPGSIVSKGVLGFLKIARRDSSTSPSIKIPPTSWSSFRTNRPLPPASRSSKRGDGANAGARRRSRRQRRAARVEGYSPRERKEVQADIFAGEFLCPADWLRNEYVQQRSVARTRSAKDLGLPLHIVMNQAIRALLLPPIGPAQPPAEAQTHLLDASRDGGDVA